MTKLLLISFLLIFISGEIYTQSFNDDAVARVGNLAISDKEFLQRYEMTPGPNRHRKSTVESSKIEFLFSLIAEKLWALEASDRNLDTTEVMRFTTKSFEKMFVRDLLFQKEIKDKISITDEEVFDGLIKNNHTLYVKFLFSEDEEEINLLYKFLNEGVSFDSILAESPEKEEQPEPIEVKFGQMAKNVEDSLFKLNVGQFTSPIITPDGWYIFKLENKSESLLLSETDKDDIEKTVRDIIEARKLIDRQKQFYAEFFRNKKVDVNPVIFESLAQKISNIFEYKKKNFELKENNLINLDVYDVLKMEQELGQDSLKIVFINIDENKITLEDYLRSLIFDGYNSTDYKINFIRASFDNRTRNFVEHELLYYEGLKRNYDQLPEVQNEVKTWRENYLFQLLKDQFRDSAEVTDQEAYELYKKQNQPETYPMIVNIIEILTDSLETVDKIYSELNEGADFKALAQKYNKREWTKKNNGEYGFFPVTQHGEIGRIASTMEVNDIYGPLKLDEGYSIFKLVGKDDEKIVPPQPFEKIKNQYKQDILYQKLGKKVSDFTYALSVKFGVSMDLNLLESIKVTTLPSFGMRFLGFGGKMTAVPLIAPNVDWAEQWIKNQQQPQVIP
jgi:parvulin-like peptidyl-prolyl isomerase